MFNLQRMISDEEIELYQISGAVVDNNPNLKLCKKSQKLLFAKNLECIQLMPLPHTNIIMF